MINNKDRFGTGTCKSNMSSIFGVSDLVSDAADDKTPASVKTLERFAGKAKSELEACNQDWGVHAKFPIPKTIPANLPKKSGTTNH